MLARVGPSDPGSLPPLPASRTCTLCGGPTRRSHSAGAGRGESVAVHVCTRCGAAHRGGTTTATERDAAARRAIDERRRRAAARPGRRPLEEGGPDNPVLDEETAARLRELLGG
jgi:hypothetical protein